MGSKQKVLPGGTRYAPNAWDQTTNTYGMLERDDDSPSRSWGEGKGKGKTEKGGRSPYIARSSHDNLGHVWNLPQKPQS